MPVISGDNSDLMPSWGSMELHTSCMFNGSHYAALKDTTDLLHDLIHLPH